MVAEFGEDRLQLLLLEEPGAGVVDLDRRCETFPAWTPELNARLSAASSFRIVPAAAFCSSRVAM